VTMVALDGNGRPTQVPLLVLETEENRRHFRDGEARMQVRLKEAGKL
jgi:acyl-CoA hydrolase